MLKINPGQPTIWLGPETLQLGLGTNAMVVDGLSPAHQRFIRALQSGIADNQVAASARQAKLSGMQAETLLARLGDRLLAAQPEPREQKRKWDPFHGLQRVAPDFAELIRFALATNADGQSALAARSARIIHVESLDRVGILVLRGLATAGFAQFWSSDTGEVAQSDCVALGHPAENLGKSRFESASQLVDRFTERIAMVDVNQHRARILDRVDFAVLIGGSEIDPNRFERWMRLGIPHIAIRFGSFGVEVSPVVIPGLTACLVCRERAEHGSGALSAKRIISLRTSKTPYDDASSAMFATGMVVAAAADHLDQLQGFSANFSAHQSWSFDRASGQVFMTQWPEASACRCGQSEAKNLDGAEGRPNESAAA